MTRLEQRKQCMRQVLRWLACWIGEKERCDHGTDYKVSGPALPKYLVGECQGRDENPGLTCGKTYMGPPGPPAHALVMPPLLKSSRIDSSFSICWPVGEDGEMRSGIIPEPSRLLASERVP